MFCQPRSVVILKQIRPAASQKHKRDGIFQEMSMESRMDPMNGSLPGICLAHYRDYTDSLLAKGDGKPSGRTLGQMSWWAPSDLTAKQLNSTKPSYMLLLYMLC